jgi:hypothetical protein
MPKVVKNFLDVGVWKPATDNKIMTTSGGEKRQLVDFCDLKTPRKKSRTDSGSTKVTSGQSAPPPGGRSKTGEATHGVTSREASSDRDKVKTEHIGEVVSSSCANNGNRVAESKFVPLF